MNRRDRRSAASRERGALKTLARTALHLELGREKSGAGTPDSNCGHCGKHLDGATSASGARPRPGDLSVCVGCGGANIFLIDLTLGKLTDEQLQIHPQYDEIVEHQNLIRSMYTKSYDRRPGEA